MGAHRFEHDAGRRTVGFAVFAVMCCLVWGLPVSAQASTAPSIESESVSHITATDATVEAQVNLHEAGAGAYYQFQVVRSPSEYASEILCPQKLPPGIDVCVGTQSASALPIGFIPGNTAQPGVDHPVSLDLASAGVTLQPGTTYHYRVLVARRVQTEDTIQWEPPTVYGPDQTFITPATGKAPSIESVSASHLTSTDATLEAQLNTEGLETSYQFRLESGCLWPQACPEITVYTLPSGKLLGSFVAQSISLDLNTAGVTLMPGTEYAYRFIAQNGAGKGESGEHRFTTSEEMVQPLNTTTPSGTNGDNQGTSSTPTGSGGSPEPSVTPLGPQIVCLCSCARGCHAKKVSPRHLTRTQKLSKALRACASKPERKRTACEKLAHQKYGPKSKKK
jgi:hypothetical protein